MVTPDIKYINHAAVLGGGAFGTALACVLANKAKKVLVWHIRKSEARQINEMRENTYVLKGIKLPGNVTFTTDLDECLVHADIVLFTIPTQFVRDFLSKNNAAFRRHNVAQSVPFVMCSKGIEQSTLLFSAQVLQSFFPDYPITFLSGPSFAVEVAKGMMTNVVVASSDGKHAYEVQQIMNTADGSFRCWITTDLIGCQVSSAMKNVLAIASGVLSGLGAGLNARAALISRGIIEIRDLTLALGGSGEAVFGLAGIGDLVLTCSSELSRNFTVGLKLGKGLKLEEIQRSSNSVAEGVATAKPLESLAKKYGVRLPIAHEVYRVLYEGRDVKKAFEKLRTGRMRNEGLPALTISAKL